MLPDCLSKSQIWRARRSPFGASETTNASRNPSGENCRSEMLRRLKEASGVRYLVASALLDSRAKSGSARRTKVNRARTEKQRFIWVSFRSEREDFICAPEMRQLGLMESHSGECRQSRGARRCYVSDSSATIYRLSACRKR